MYPINVPGLVRNNLIGMNGDDPTLPYAPPRRHRLMEPLRALVRRRSAPPAPASYRSDPRGRTPASVAAVALTGSDRTENQSPATTTVRGESTSSKKFKDANGNTCLQVDARFGDYWPESGLDPEKIWCPASS